MIGDVVKKYESGDKGSDAISNDKNDPGGASYGTYQLSSNAGTLRNFLVEKGYQKDFTGLVPGSPGFNAMWHKMSRLDSFCTAQYEFIKETHYDPLRTYANSVNILNTPAIDEALWSMSIQHGRCKTIVTYAVVNFFDHDMDEVKTVKALYRSRCHYVETIGMSYLINQRYAQELKDVLGMIKS